MERVKIKEEPPDPLYLPEIKIEPIEEEISVTPPVQKTYCYNRKRANPNNGANCEPIAKKSAITEMRVLSKKCALCSNRYEMFEGNLDSSEVKSVCLVLGISSPHSSFEKLILQNLPICSACTDLFKAMHSEFTNLNEADRKLKECVRKIGFFLTERQMLTADKENLGRVNISFFSHIYFFRMQNTRSFYFAFRKVRKSRPEESETTRRLKSK